MVLNEVITEMLREREKVVRPFIEKYAPIFEVDPNLVRALITQESRFSPKATSPTGAFGFGQFTNIAAKQIQNIAKMNASAHDLETFTKAEAADPERGVMAVCAMLWWLFSVKFSDVEDKKVRLEACLTFYNAGGKAASLVVEHGGHAQAIPFIKQLPSSAQSQSITYAPEVIAWFIQWHELFQSAPVTPHQEASTIPAIHAPVAKKHLPLIEALKLIKNVDEGVDVVIHTREGTTEVSILLPGEYNHDSSSQNA